MTITVNNAAIIQVPAYIVVDREDASGSATPNSREVMYATAKASNDLTVTRGVNNSTARAHNDGAIVEPMFTVGFWTDAYTALTAEHSTAGVHDATKVAMLAGAQTITGAKTFTTGLLKAVDITSGAGVSILPTVSDTLVGKTTTDTLTNKTITDSTNDVMAKSLKSATTTVDVSAATAPSANQVLTATSSTAATWQTAAAGLSSKIIQITRDITAATGNVAYTGVGFTPTSMTGLGNIDGTTQMCWGFVDSSKAGKCVIRDTDGNNYHIGSFIKVSTAAGSAFQTAAVLTFDADGFTLTWTKTGSPSGTATVDIICYK